MNGETERHEITKKRVVYSIQGMDALTVRRDVEYSATDAGSLTMDIYYPPGSTIDAPTPAVVFVIGYSDLGAQKILGCRFKEMESFVSWGRLMAASGLVAITYATGREPAEDIHALLEYVRRNAASLGIDENKIGLWACSGHVPNALSVLMEPTNDYLKCAVFCYGNMLDLEGDTGVAEAAQKFRFVNPSAGKTVDDLPPSTPLFIARAGRDEFPHLNEAIDRFVASALVRNLPVTLTNHALAPHAFDVMHDSETSREVIRQILAFMRHNLLSAEPSM